MTQCYLPSNNYSIMHQNNHNLFKNCNYVSLNLCYNRPFNYYIYRKITRSSCVSCEKKSNEAIKSNEPVHENQQDKDSHYAMTDTGSPAARLREAVLKKGQYYVVDILFAILRW